MDNIRNQYVLLRKEIKEINKPENWKEEEFNDFRLFVSPELLINKHEANNASYIILGFAFNVLDSSYEMKDIIRNIPDNYEDFIKYVDILCGNFIIFREDNSSLTVLNDAGGALKIFYYYTDKKILSAATDPALIKRFFPLQSDNSIDAQEFYNSQSFLKTKIRLGNKTEFVNVFQLLPNHLLNFTTAQTIRYFPQEPLEKLSADTSIEKVHFYLSNVIDAAIEKYDLKCGLTAGWDSRMVLASTMKHKNKIAYYTFKRTGKNNENIDITVAKQIANKLGLKYQVIPINNKIPDDQLNQIEDNYSLIPKQKFSLITNGFSKFNSENSIALIGVISEIAKNYYEAVKICDGITLSKAAHFDPINYVVAYQQKKYDDLKPLCEKYQYDLRDLAHWEQDITNFAAQGIQYNSFVIKTLSPFNSRLIIKTLLAAPRKMRDKHIHQYYKKYLKKYHPELSSYPVNPTLKKKMIVLGKKARIYGIYKNIMQKLIK